MWPSHHFQTLPVSVVASVSTFTGSFHNYDTRVLSRVLFRCFCLLRSPLCAYTVLVCGCDIPLPSTFIFRTLFRSRTRTRFGPSTFLISARVSYVGPFRRSCRVLFFSPPVVVFSFTDVVFRDPLTACYPPCSFVLRDEYEI